MLSFPMPIRTECELFSLEKKIRSSPVASAGDEKYRSVGLKAKLDSPHPFAILPLSLHILSRVVPNDFPRDLEVP